MNIYVICPVRNQSDEQKLELENYKFKKEAEGDKVFLPHLDAPQKDISGVEIVRKEIEAINWADEVHLFWDSNSKGSHFDLGVAFALKKKIVIIKEYQERPAHSYMSVVALWEIK